MTTELTLSPALADELKSLRRTDAGSPVVINATEERDRGTPERTSPQFVREGVPLSFDVAKPVLAEVDRLSGPVILATDRPFEAATLALCCACTIAYVRGDAELGAVDPAAALELNLAGRLTKRLGPGAAAQILLGTPVRDQPSVLGSPEGDQGQRVATVTTDPLAAARATAARLAEPAGALLARSLAFAARSTPAQAAAYDRELLALLTDREL
jgi:hypothetical protein